MLRSFGGIGFDVSLLIFWISRHIDRGQPTTFAPNQVIKGWTEAMQMMVEGDKWQLYIPSGKKLVVRNFDMDVP